MNGSVHIIYGKASPRHALVTRSVLSQETWVFSCLCMLVSCCQAIVRIARAHHEPTGTCLVPCQGTQWSQHSVEVICVWVVSVLCWHMPQQLLPIGFEVVLVHKTDLSSCYSEMSCSRCFDDGDDGGGDGDDDGVYLKTKEIFVIHLFT